MVTPVGVIISLRRSLIGIINWGEAENSGDRAALPRSEQPISVNTKIIKLFPGFLYLSNLGRLPVLMGEREDCCRLTAKYM